MGPVEPQARIPDLDSGRKSLPWAPSPSCPCAVRARQGRAELYYSLSPEELPTLTREAVETQPKTPPPIAVTHWNRSEAERGH